MAGQSGLGRLGWVMLGWIRTFEHRNLNPLLYHCAIVRTILGC
jgi:hypothetical protein